MAPDTEERRADTVAIPRATVRVVTWIASLSFIAVASFIWDSGNKVDDLRAENRVLNLRIKHLEDIRTDLIALRADVQTQAEVLRDQGERCAVADSRIGSLEKEVSSCCGRELYKFGIGE